MRGVVNDISWAEVSVEVLPHRSAEQSSLAHQNVPSHGIPSV